MKKIFSANNLKVLAGTVIIILGIMLISGISGNSLISSFVGLVTTPMQQLSGNMLQATGKLSESGKSADELQAENQELRQKLNEMIALTVDYYDIKRQNEQNTKYLELKEKKKDYKFASASVIGRGTTEMFYNFTIDQGSVLDIQKYDPVITEKGLVGWVSEVHPTYSKVTSLLSPETKVSVLNQVTQDSGVTSGNLRYADLGVIKMNFASDEGMVSKGDIVVTSGIGGIYPGELPVGEVEDIYQEENSADKDIIIRPYEDIQKVSNVFVITEFLGQGDIISDSYND